MVKISYEKINWEDVENNCYTLNEKFRLDKYSPEIIMGLSRGGVIPARILSDILNNTNLYFFDAKLYDGTNKTDKVIIRCDISLSNIRNKKIILVDDIYDSGTTMKAVIKYLNDNKVYSVLSATLYTREGIQDQPNYFSKIVKRKDWIVFPWEKNEFKEQK